MRWTGPLGILILLLAPAAAAVPAQGTLLTDAAVSLPAGSQVEGALLGAFAADTARATSFRLTSPELLVTRITAKYTDADALGLHLGTRIEREVATYELHDVTLALAPGDHAGWWGLAPHPGGAFSGGSSSPAALAPSAPSRIGNEATGDAQASPSFDHEIPEPHLTATLEALAYRGGGAVKWSGLDVVATARENATTWETGRERASRTVALVEQTWMILEFSEATLQLAAPDGLLAAAGTVAATWTGTCSFFAQEGEVAVEGDENLALRSQAVVMSGTFRGSFAPDVVAGDVLLRGAWEGDLGASTALLSARAPTPRGGVPAWLVLVAASVLAGGAGLLVGRKRSTAKPHDALAPDEWLALAKSASERGDHEQALDWVRRAREGSPGSVRLALEEGFCLEELGRIGDALDAYAEASALDDSGEGDFHTARVLLEHGLDDGAAQARLVHALQKAPVLVLDVASDPVFAALCARPAVRAAMRRARATLDAPRGGA